MLVVFVHVTVKSDQIEEFKAATVQNARQSLAEPGIARFDVVQRQDVPQEFVLIEVYRTAEAPAQHKETPHYKTWRDAVEVMMEKPRHSVKYDNVFPDDGGW